MKPQQQGFILNRSSGTSREYESASDWELWEQMITQASQQNRQQRQRYITTEERTLLDRQSSVIRAQYDIAKHELLSNSSISVVQNIDIKSRNNSKHLNDKPKRIKGHLKPNASDKRTKESNQLNECCSYCNLTTAHVEQLNKGQRHRLGVAHNLFQRTGCVELNSRSSAISRHKVGKQNQGRAECLKAKPVRSETITNSLTKLQTIMTKSRPEKSRLIKDSKVFDKTMLKSNKAVKKYQHNAEHTKMPTRQDLDNTAKCLIPAPDTPVSEKELNDSKYDFWYDCRQKNQKGNKLISLEEIAQQKTGTPSEQSCSFFQLQIVSRPKYRETMQNLNKRKGKSRYSERKDRTEARRCLELNYAKSEESAGNSTLKEEYSYYSKSTLLRQAADIKSSLALNVECNKNNNIWPWEGSQPQTHGVSETNRKHLSKEKCKEGHVLKRCSRELKLYSGQSETESMIITVLNPTNQSADSELLSSLFESSDFVVKRDKRENATAKLESNNNFTSLSVLRAMCKEAHTCLNVKNEGYVSASSNLLVKPAIENLHEVCEKFEDKNEFMSLKLDVASSMSYQGQETVHFFDGSTKANGKIIQNRLCIKDSQSTMTNVYRKGQDKDNIFTIKMSSSVINISSLSLLRSRKLRKLPRMDATIDADIKIGSNIFNRKKISAASFILSSVTSRDNICPIVCRRSRIIMPASRDISEYLETPNEQPLTDSILKSSSKISLFQSDSISNILISRQTKVLLNRISLDSTSNTSSCRLAQPNNELVSLDSQLINNIEIVQSKETYEIPTLRKSPGKNALDKQAMRSQFSQSFCTMNLRIPAKDFTTAKQTKDINNYLEKESRLSVLYQKDLNTRTKNKKKTDSQMKNIPKVTRRSVSKEWSRIIKPIKSQKHMGSNLKNAKYQKNDRSRLLKYTTLEKALEPRGLTARHKQESKPKLVKRDRIKSPAKRISHNHIPISSHEVTQIGTNSNFNIEFFKDIKSWPTSYPITSGSKNRNHSWRKNSGVNDVNEMRLSNKLHKSDEDIDEDNEVRFVTSYTLLPEHKSEIKENNRLQKRNSEIGANRGWKSVIDKCVKSIKSMTTKKTSKAIDTNAQCFSKCKQWEQSCYFCAVSRETPQINKINTPSKIGYMEYKDDDSFLKRCPGTLNFHKNRKVQDTSKIKKTYTKKLNNKIGQEYTEQARVIYQNPALYISRICNSYKYSKQTPMKLKTLGTKTNDSNISTVSTITSQPLNKSKSTQSFVISKHQNKVPKNPKLYKIETIYPLTCNKFNRSKSEIILLQSSNINCRKRDESNIPNDLQGIQFYSVSNKSRVLKKREDKLNPSKGSEHVAKSPLIGNTYFKRFLFRCTTLFKRNNKILSKPKAIEIKSMVNELDNKCFRKEAKPSFKSPKQHRRHTKVQRYVLKKSNSLIHSGLCKSLKITKECQRGKLDKTHFQESLQSKRNTARGQSGDTNSLTSKISNKEQCKDCSPPSNCYKQDKVFCGYAQIQPNKVVKKSRAKLFRESLHKNFELSRFHYLSDKIQSQKSVNFKKTNCQVIKTDVGINCIRKKRLKHKTKCVQVELWDKKTVLMMSGDRKNCDTLECKTISEGKKREAIELKEKKCGRMTFGIKRNDTNYPLSRENVDDFTKEYQKEFVTKLPNEKKEKKITHYIVTKCKNFLKINKPQIKQACEGEYFCYRYVDCNITRDKVQKKKRKHLDLDNANNFKCTPAPLKVKKTESSKPARLTETAVKALQVDSKKLLKGGKINQIKFVVKPKELITLPFKGDGKKNEATVCHKAKQKNKYIKTEDVDPISCCKSANTDDLIEVSVKQKPTKNTAKDKKTLSSLPSINRQNDISKYINNSMKHGVMRGVKPKHQKNTISAIEALLLHEPARASDANVNPQCVTTIKTKKIEPKTKRKKEKTNVKAKREKSTQKPVNITDKGVVSGSTANTSKKLALPQTLVKKKLKENNAKTKTAISLNKAVMTKDILVSSCCTNTTPSIDKKIGTRISTKIKLQRNTAIGKKVSPSNKAVKTEGVDVSSRSTNTTLTFDKKVKAKIYAKEKREKNKERRALSCPSRSTCTTVCGDRKVKAEIYSKKKIENNEERRALSCPRAMTSKAKRTGISLKVTREKTAGVRKRPQSDSSINKCGKPLIKGTQTKTKRMAKQINATQEMRVPKKVKTKIYTTEDKQTSASSKCILPLKPPSKEAPVKYPTMMSANRTKQVCCAFFTAGAWHNSKSTISRSNQASASAHKPLTKNLQVMTTHGVSCNMEKQRNSRKSKCVDVSAKENVKQLKQDSNIPLSKSSPCCICGNAICEECKVKFITKIAEKGQKNKKLKKLKTKGGKDTKTNNNFTKSTKEEKRNDKLNKRKATDAAKEARKVEKINKRAANEENQNEKLNNRIHKHLAKEAKKMEKLNKGKNKSMPKKEKKMEKINKKKNIRVPKKKNEVEKLNKGKNKSTRKEVKMMKKIKKGNNKIIPKEERKKGKTLITRYISVTKDRPSRKYLKESKRKNRDAQKQTARTKRFAKDDRVKTTRVPFPLFGLLRIQKKNQRDLESQQLYKTPARRRMILFVYVRSCGYFVRAMLRRLLGCLFFALGVIVWTPGICCFECCRECFFTSCK